MADDQPGFFRRNAWVMALAALVVVAGGVTAVSLRAGDDALIAQETRIAELEAQLDAVDRRQAEQADQDVFTALGITRSRVASDRTILADLLEPSFTWSSGEEYEEAREFLKGHFGLTEDDAYLATFLPPAEFNQHVSGERFYYIDSLGLTSSLTRTQVEVAEVEGTEYAYVVIADIEMSAPAPAGGTATVQRRLLLNVTIDGDGDLSDLSGTPPSGATRTAQ